MNRKVQASSYKKLIKVYNYRLTVAEAKLSAARNEVAKTEAELVERKGKIAKIDQDIEANRHYIGAAEEGSMAKARQMGSRHFYWLDYDKQKESFYLDLTYGELEEKTAELVKQQHIVEKLKAKIEAIEKMQKKIASGVQRSLQRVAESEFGAARREEMIDVE